nr:DNA/RNA helicase domain-containing protein [Acinetobacter sp. YH12136]
MPALDELTKNQRDIYLYAPIDTNVLVSGPPGCGKTLIAGLRAEEMVKRGMPTKLAMFNSVLKQYTQGKTEESYQTITITRFFADWIENSLAEMLKGTFDLRTFIAEKRRQIYWEKLTNFLEEQITNEALQAEEFSFGYLIVDEGQDFPPTFYSFLNCLAFIGNFLESEYPLKCLVLADENQKLTDNNSTLDEIKEMLNVDDEHYYKLVDNFRNSKEVAKLAKSFFANVGVMPVEPTRCSEIPELIQYQSVFSFLDYLNVWLKNHPGKEVGILCFKENTRSHLEKEIRKYLDVNYRFQTYSSKTYVENPVTDLQFDVPNTLTLLNVQSCKGLEFDTVFLVNPADLKLDDASLHLDKMTLFVATSRARDIVKMINYNNFDIENSRVKILPPHDILSRINWDSPHLPVTKANTQNWEDATLALIAQYQLDYFDRSEKGGYFWIYTDMKLSTELLQLGFQYAEEKGAWWREGEDKA